jgi:hypothetical protein
MQVMIHNQLITLNQGSLIGQRRIQRAKSMHDGIILKRKNSSIFDFPKSSADMFWVYTIEDTVRIEPKVSCAFTNIASLYEVFALLLWVCLVSPQPVHGFCAPTTHQAQNLGMPTEQAIVLALESTFVDRVILDVGLVVALYDILSIADGFVFHSDGGPHYSVKFRAVIFRPFEGELLVGKVEHMDS